MNNSYKILIIDDEKATLNVLCQSLTRNNYEVVGVDNGLDGKKQVEDPQTHFDLIITDLVMPDISGVAIISIAKRLYPDLPVVAITGWGEHPELLAAEAQADSILSKPIDLKELHHLVLELIQKKENPDSPGG